jgi:hypothetical protein
MRLAILFVLAFCQSAFGANGLAPGEFLSPGQSCTSPDGRFALTLQLDGNLVWHYGERVLWSSGTQGTKEARCEMQLDGNLVISGLRYDAHRTIWAINTFNRPEKSWSADRMVMLF